VGSGRRRRWLGALTRVGEGSRRRGAAASAAAQRPNPAAALMRAVGVGRSATAAEERRRADGTRARLSLPIGRSGGTGAAAADWEGGTGKPSADWGHRAAVDG
jgi:hypothetical protein